MVRLPRYRGGGTMVGYWGMGTGWYRGGGPGGGICLKFKGKTNARKLPGPPSGPATETTRTRIRVRPLACTSRSQPCPDVKNSDFLSKSMLNLLRRLG